MVFADITSQSSTQRPTHLAFSLFPPFSLQPNTPITLLSSPQSLPTQPLSMTAGPSTPTSAPTLLFRRLIIPKSAASPIDSSPSIRGLTQLQIRRKPNFTVCFVLDEKKQTTQTRINDLMVDGSGESARQVAAERMERKKSERFTYLIAAVMSSFGVTSMAVMAVYYRFSWQMEGGDVPLVEMFGTFALSVGAAVGMEFWARWAHKALWHASLWNMHESHHKPREGPFEVNDVFAIVNAVPAIALLNYGFFHKGIVPGLCFGAGLGITVFGMAYMFVHDGLVHKRFPVGPIANVPYLRRVAAAHQLHHTEKFDGVPYGLFMGPKELEEVGGEEELEKEIIKRIKMYKGS